MRFSTIFLLPSVILAAPAFLDVRADEPCAPTTYTLSDYTLIISESAASVNFNFTSAFAPGAVIEDFVTAGANCNASGHFLPNNNVCNVPEDKLLFDLRAAQDGARYQITHTWVCNGKTWMSGNDVSVVLLDCNDVDGQRTCSGGPMAIDPQNVRKICNAPRC